MKLKKDFGVKALLATLSVMGFIAMALLMILLGRVTTETLAILGMVATLATAATGTYFGARANSNQ